MRLSADILDALKSRNALPTDAIEDVIWGNVPQVCEQGACLARSAVLSVGFRRAGARPRDHPLLRQRAQAVKLAANQVRAGAGTAMSRAGSR